MSSFLRAIAGLAVVATLSGVGPLARGDESRGGDEPAAARAPPYSMIRYLEDHDGSFAVGGQHRLRYELLDASDLGVAGKAAKSSALFSRNLLHVDLHVLPELRLFTQLGAYYALGTAERARPPDADDVDVAQVFVETRATAGALRMVTRVGRQELALGSTRWVGVRDGTNVRQSFDLVRLTLESATRAGPWTVETFVGAVPNVRRGAFDDAPSARERFWGSYATVALLPAKLLAIDAFYLARGRPSGTRHTFGTRVFGQTRFGLEYIEHAIVQTGTENGKHVLAWGFATALWQRLPGALSPVRIGVRGDALSGDTTPNDGRVSTFQPLFPNQTFFSALPAIYPTNLYDVHPLAKVDLGSVDLEAGCIFFWRQTVEDAIYQPPGAPAIAGNPGGSRFTATQPSLSFGYHADRHLAFNAEYSHLFAGPGIVRAGGGDVDYFGTWTTYTY